MTLFGWFLTLPLWIKIIIYVILGYLFIEALLMPYRANVRNQQYKDIKKLMEAILEASKANTKEFEDVKRIESLLLGMLGKKKSDKDE